MMTSFWPVSAHFQSGWWLCYCLALWLQMNLLAASKGDAVVPPLGNFRDQKSSHREEKKKLSTKWSRGAFLVLNDLSICKKEKLWIRPLFIKKLINRKCVHKTVRQEFWHFYIVFLCLHRLNWNSNLNSFFWDMHGFKDND